MESINMNYLDIKGYDKLSLKAKQIFDRVDRKHTQCVENKAAWTPVRVKERETNIEVHFKNGKWLHYMPNGTWY